MLLPSLPPRRYWTSWRARALRATAESWLLDCGAGVRLQAWHSPGAGARNSIGIMLVSGMIIGTVFTLFVVPSGYVLVSKARATAPASLDASEGAVVAGLEGAAA